MSTSKTFSACLLDNLPEQIWKLRFYSLENRKHFSEVCLEFTQLLHNYLCTECATNLVYNF